MKNPSPYEKPQALSQHNTPRIVADKKEKLARALQRNLRRRKQAMAKSDKGGKQ